MDIRWLTTNVSNFCQIDMVQLKGLQIGYNKNQLCQLANIKCAICKNTDLGDPNIKADTENYVVFWAGDALKPAVCAPCHTKEQQKGHRNKRVRKPKQW